MTPTTSILWDFIIFSVFFSLTVSSPKNLRTTSAKRQEKSPNLNVSRKTNQNIVSSLRISNTSDVNLAKQKAASVHIASPNDSNAASSDDDSDHINTDKLKTIRNKAAQRYVVLFYLMPTKSHHQHCTLCMIYIISVGIFSCFINYLCHEHKRSLKSLQSARISLFWLSMLCLL